MAAPLAAAIAIVIAMAEPSPAVADTVERWRAPIAEASQRFGIPVAWIERVMRAESGGSTTLAGRPIVSPAGAMGLMQLMPATWRDVRSRLALGHDPHDPRDNIFAGTFYLRAMYDQFGYPGLFAAYNAGPARYADYRARGRPLPRETRTYVAMIAGNGVGSRNQVGMSQRGPALQATRTGHSGIFFLRRPGTDESPLIDRTVLAGGLPSADQD